MSNGEYGKTGEQALFVTLVCMAFNLLYSGGHITSDGHNFSDGSDDVPGKY